MARNRNKNGRKSTPSAIEKLISARQADEEEAERRDSEAAEAEYAAETNGLEATVIKAVAQVLRYQAGYTPYEHFLRECNFCNNEDVTIAKIQGILDVVEEHPVVSGLILEANNWQIDPNLTYRYMADMSAEDRNHAVLTEALKHEMIFRALIGGTYSHARRSGDANVPNFNPSQHELQTIISWQGNEPQQIAVTSSFPAFRANYAAEYFQPIFLNVMEYIGGGYEAANIVSWTYTGKYNGRNFMLVFRKKSPTKPTVAGEMMQAFNKIISRQD